MHEGSTGPSHDPTQIYSTTKRLETPPMVLIHVVPVLCVSACRLYANSFTNPFVRYEND